MEPRDRPHDADLLTACAVLVDLFDQAGAIPVVAGPTAVGKTEHSLVLAESIGAEIISADSRQVYRGMTIGTAKPEPAELARVPHHFVDELDLDEPFSAGAFATQAHARIDAIRARGRVPLVVGGSTLYLHALIHGLADVPPVSLDVRKRLEERLLIEGGEALFAELARVDPVFAATLDPTKTQRLIRGLEVFHATGRPLSAYHDAEQSPRTPFQIVVLNRPRPVLYERINRRVDAMLASGLVGEVRRLLEIGAQPTAPPLRTIGYREAIAYLAGAFDHAEMVRLIKRNSRRYAKRQLTWFRRYPSYRFFDLQ